MITLAIFQLSGCAPALLSQECSSSYFLTKASDIMAETAGQVETEIDEKEQEEKEHVSRCQRIRKLFSFKNFGKALRYFIIFVWAMHINIFWCCLICVAAITVLSEGVDDTNDIWFIPTFIWFPLGTAVTPSVVVFLINSVGEYWSEIQSWQIFYIVWGYILTVFSTSFDDSHQSTHCTLIRQ